MDEVTREWRKLHNEELNDLYSSQNIVRMIKSRRMGWAVHVARMGIVEAYTWFWWGYLREREPLEDLGVNEKIILKHIFKKFDRGMDWIDLAYDGDRCGAVVNAVMNLLVQ
jgi:hypothetical protein